MLLAISALSAFLAFLSRYAPDFFAEFVFFDSVPIMYFLTFYNKSFRYQIVSVASWAALFHAFAGIGILGIYNEYGSEVLWMSMYLSFIVYASLTATILFCITRRITQRFRKLSAIIFFVTFWLFIDCAFFMPFGNLEGNRLFSPLLPLAVRPQWLYFCRYLPVELCIIFVVITNYIICNIFFARWKLKICCLYLSVLCLFWMSGWLLWSRQESSRELSMIVEKSTAPIGLVESGNNEAFVDWCRKKGERKWIFLPETFLRCHETNLMRAYCSWYDIIDEQITIIGGGAIIDSSNVMKNKIHNVILKICSSRTEILYEKEQNMFLTESKSAFLTWCGLQKPFKYRYANKKLLTNKRHTNNEITIEGFGKTRPYICSEFIFQRDFFTKNSKHGETILWVVNDAWSKYAYVGRLMVLYARQNAIARRQRVFFIGYREASVFDEFGIKYSLTS